MRNGVSQNLREKNTKILALDNLKRYHDTSFECKILGFLQIRWRLRSSVLRTE